MRYLALGDSYTVGEGVAPAESWPFALARKLRDQGRPLAAPDVVAVTGWTTDELQAGLAGRELAPPYALVSLMIGVNNQYRGRELAEYRGQFDELLRFAVAMAGNQPLRVLVVSIPDWGVTPTGAADPRSREVIAAAIDAFNAAAREITEAAGCRFVDITPLSRACGDAPGMLVADGLHPSAAQYRRWLPVIAEAARECLATS